jgi:O-antigen/teichoic acid export membrane protein
MVRIRSCVVPVVDERGPLEPDNPTDVLDEPTAGGRVIRGSALRTGAYAAGVGVGLVSAALMTRYLGVDDFGKYVTVFSIVTVAAGMSDVGLANIGVREYSIREGADRDRAMRNLLGLRIALTTFAALVAVLFAAVAGYEAVLIVGTALAALGYGLYTAQQTLAVPLSAALRFGWLANLDLVRQVGMLAVVVVLVVVGAGLLAFLATPIPVALAVLVATAWLVRGSIPLTPAFQPRAWWELLRLVLPYAAASAVGAIYVNLVVVLTSLVSSETETGYFGAAFRVFAVISAVPGLLIASAFPVLARAARDDRSRLRYALQRLWDISLLLGVGTGLLTAVGAGIAIAVVAGDEFAPAADVLRIQAIALLASFLVATWGYALLSLAAYASLLVANAIALALSAVLTLALAPDHGAQGAAVATAVGESALALALGVLLMARRPDLRVDAGLVPRVVVAVALGGAVVLIPGLPEVVDLVLAGAIYVGALVVLRAVPHEIWDALRRREPSS